MNPFQRFSLLIIFIYIMSLSLLACSGCSNTEVSLLRNAPNDAKLPKELIRLIEAGNVDLVKEFIEKHAVDLTAQDEYGRNVLHHALYQNLNLELVKYLVAELKKKNPDQLLAALHKIGGYQGTPFMQAMCAQSRELVQFFLDSGAAPSVWELGTGLSFLVKSFNNANLEPSETGEKIDFSGKAIDFFRFLLANMSPQAYVYVLFEAVTAGKFALVKWLVKKEELLAFDKNIKNSVGNTLLHQAVQGGDLNIVKLVLQQKLAGVDVLNEAGKAALHLAIEQNLFAIVKELLKNQASATLPDGVGKTPLKMAEENAQGVTRVTNTYPIAILEVLKKKLGLK